MKITAIEIIGFGKWQQKRIEFDSGNQLLYGENEVGKSTIYQFIQTMLFGFPAKGKRKRDYAPKNGGAFGGRLWLDHPTFGSVQVDRFKDQNKGQATVYYQQQVGDEQTLQKMLHPLTKKLFQEIFTFQQEQFTAVDKLNEEELQTSLLAIGVAGSQELLNYRKHYFKDAQRIFKGKGTQPPLNQQLIAYQKLQRQIAEKEQQQQIYQATIQQLITIRQQLAALRGRLKKLRNQQLKVKEQERNFVFYEELQALPPQTEVLNLPEGDQAQLEAGYQEFTYVTEELNKVNQDLKLPRAKMTGADLYPFYLEEEANIQQLLNQRFDIQQLVTEVEWLEQAVKQKQQAMKPLEQKWSWSSQQPPCILDFETIQQMQATMLTTQVELQRARTQYKLLEEEIATHEADLTAFEAAHPEVFQKTSRQDKPSLQKIKSVWLGSSALLLVAGIFLPSPLRYVLWLSAFALLGVALWPLQQKKPVSVNQGKKQWQEKLFHLDYLHEQLATLQNELQSLQHSEAQQLLQVQQQTQSHNLGRLNSIELWLNHREEVERYLVLLKQAAELQQQLSQKQPQLEAVAERINYFTDELPLQGKGLTEKIAAIQRFAEEMEAIRFNHEAQATSYTKQVLRELKERKQALLNRMQPLLIRYQIMAMTDVPAWLQQLRKKKEQQLRAKELTQRLEGLFQEPITKAQLHAQAQNINHHILKQEENIQQLQAKEQELLYQQQQILADGSLDELYQMRASLIAAIEEMAVNWSAYQLAGQLLLDLLLELSEQQLPSLLKKATDYFQILSDQHYQALQIEAGTLQVLTEKHETFFVHELSTGTKDQLTMALRFAFLALQGDKMLCPIIIDDGWLHYDYRRKQHLAKLFAEFGKKYQVICFSSDQEMVSYYQELVQPIHYLQGGAK